MSKLIDNLANNQFRSRSPTLMHECGAEQEWITKLIAKLRLIYSFVRRKPIGQKWGGGEAIICLRYAIILR